MEDAERALFSSDSARISSQMWVNLTCRFAVRLFQCAVMAQAYEPTMFENYAAEIECRSDYKMKLALFDTAG